MAKEPVLKTGAPCGLVGSNPAPSAIFDPYVNLIDDIISSSTY